MGLIQEIKERFGVDNLYEALDLTSDASDADLKKAYRRLSLKHHPDKFSAGEDEKVIEAQTLRFQTLAKVYKVLSDSEKRALYDENGLILDDQDSLSDEKDWMQYWRLLFPKITQNDITAYMKKYTGSEEEKKDLIYTYNRFEGDLNKISECMIGYEEKRTKNMINELIKDGDVKAYDAFVNESAESIKKREKRFKKEKKRFVKSNSNEADEADEALILALSKNREKREHDFNSLIGSLEAKYGSAKKNSTKKQRKS